MTVETKEELDAAMAEFEKTGSFRDVVMKHSKANNADNGGYLGWVELSFLEGDIRDAVAGVKKGITKPVKDSGGYRVFFVENFRHKEDLNSDKKEQIVIAMQKMESQRIFESWMVEKKKEILIQKKYAD
jgi:peptidyl-prolyl cis-trans isomerase SurA